jgi:hypothetical protein
LEFRWTLIAAGYFEAGFDLGGDGSKLISTLMGA